MWSSIGISFAAGLLSGNFLSRAFTETETERRPQEEDDEDTPGKKINLAHVAAGLSIGAVPAHGWIAKSKLLTRVAGALRRVAGGWIGKFARATGVAALIGGAVFVYNRFVGKWAGLGLPTMPISTFGDSTPHGPHGASSFTGHSYVGGPDINRRPDRSYRSGSLGEYIG